jgi:hypothetical protein
MRRILPYEGAYVHREGNGQKYSIEVEERHFDVIFSVTDPNCHAHILIVN